MLLASAPLENSLLPVDAAAWLRVGGQHVSSLVLVTGAAGRLGRGVLAAYADVGIPTRALVL